MTVTRPALRLLQALLGLLLLVGAWQATVPASSLPGATGAWTQDEGGLAALADADGGWVVALADPGDRDLFDDGADPDEAATPVRSVTNELLFAEGSADRAPLALPPPRLRWLSSLSTGPPAA